MTSQVDDTVPVHGNPTTASVRDNFSVIKSEITAIQSFIDGLGTAAHLDVPVSGNASTTQVVKGDDTRLTNSRTPTAHTHVSTEIVDSTIIGRSLLTSDDAAAVRAVLSVPSGSGTSTGTNTGDQISVTGNAGTATALQTARTIDGQPFDGTADITIIAPGTFAATSKSTPVDADALPITDSAASNTLKKLTWANVKATLKTYFDTLYQANIDGAVIGPASVADGDVALFNGVTGKLIKSGGKLIDTVLTGLSTATNAVITAADTVLTALGKLQKQITDNLATLTSHTGAAAPHTGHVAKAGDTLTGALNWAATQTTASATTTDIGSATSNVVIISGTTTITGLGTIAAGAERCVTFSGTLTLTHNATSLILPGGANITTAAGDVAYFASLGAGNWRCTTYVRANGTPLVPLLNFLESVNTASPNAGTPVVSLAATNAATNVDVALVPKGQGAITAQIADGTAAGGNKRGSWAVDLQMFRATAAQVASGACSFAAGVGCTASGMRSIAVGNSAAALGHDSAAVGGFANQATGQFAFAGGGNYNVADARLAYAFGNTARARGIANSWQVGFIERASADRQKRHLPLIALTTNTTPTTLTTDGNVESVINTWVLPNNFSGLFVGYVIARNTSNNDSIAWEFKGLVSRDGSAATIALLGAVTPTTIGTADASMTTCALTVGVNTTNGSLRVQGTGLAATQINWVGEIGPVFENG